MIIPLDTRQDEQWKIDHYKRWSAANNVARLRKVYPRSNVAAEYLAGLLGYKDWNKLREVQAFGSEEEKQRLENQLEALAGPHALTIIKVLQIRKKHPHLSTDA